MSRFIFITKFKYNLKEEDRPIPYTKVTVIPTVGLGTTVSLEILSRPWSRDQSPVGNGDFSFLTLLTLGRRAQTLYHRVL